MYAQGYLSATPQYALPNRLPASRLCWPRLSSISSMNRAGSSGDVVPMGLPGDPRRWTSADRAMAACATSPDWYLDCAAFGGIWAGLWAACCRLQPSPRTVVLLNVLPLMHMSGALGAYHWELGNLSWDILCHISNGFIGTLLFASCLSDMSHTAHSTPHAAATSLQAQHSNQPAAAAAAAGTSLIEVVEACGGVLAGEGEGIFLRGAGDYCTASLPCSEEVDTMKDMVDNVAGMMLALLALATGSRGSSGKA
ncbi:hypothetical protein OEZ85_014163 [Tetradesmus obliquus]|uniref:Peptidase S54 rhomboid domain-containing protein n=1 Tax=Tetradesmus obliquus TaxID=3088 RepID=A0ABY8UB36_TETOB|nr:hypothetical protein OEZ85_014163 [Tetradesmus obliquus]